VHLNTILVDVSSAACLAGCALVIWRRAYLAMGPLPLSGPHSGHGYGSSANANLAIGPLPLSGPHSGHGYGSSALCAAV